MRLQIRSHIIIAILLILMTSISHSQFSWNTAPDSIKINPTVYSIEGSVVVNLLGPILCADNTIQIDFKNKYVYVNNFNNIYKFSFDQVSKIYLPGSEEINGPTLYDSDFRERITNSYRKSIYEKVDLNVISFTYSRKNKLAITNDGRLYIKNEKKMSGKICSIGLDYIETLTENGELLKLNDGDFISLSAAGIISKNCKTLYNLVFGEFKKELERKVTTWVNTTTQLDMPTLIKDYGPLQSIKEINSDLKQYEWGWPLVTYNINVTSNSRQIGLNNSSRNTYYYGTSNTSIYGSTGSSLFLYGNSFRSYNGEGIFSGISNTLSSTSQNGSVIMTDEGASIIIIKDKSGKTISLKHKGLFSDLDYGSAFIFIKY